MKDDLTNVDGKFYKKHQLVMLATENVRDSKISLKNEVLQLTDLKVVAMPQHLYILSGITYVDKGDWYYSKFEKTIKQSDSKCQSFDIDKIIATTNPELKIESMIVGKTIHIPYPRPSDDFTKKFIKEYNKGTVISEVLVEYKKTHIEGLTIFGIFKEYELKVAPDNTITIKKAEDDWDSIYTYIHRRNPHYSGLANDLIIEVIGYLKESYNPPTKKK
jgi:hypothetical protein